MSLSEISSQWMSMTVHSYSNYPRNGMVTPRSQSSQNPCFWQVLGTITYLLHDASKMAEDGPRRPHIIRKYIGMYIKLSIKLYEIM